MESVNLREGAHKLSTQLLYAQTFLASSVGNTEYGFDV